MLQKKTSKIRGVGKIEYNNVQSTINESYQNKIII